MCILYVPETSQRKHSDKNEPCLLRQDIHTSKLELTPAREVGLIYDTLPTSYTYYFPGKTCGKTTREKQVSNNELCRCGETLAMVFPTPTIAELLVHLVCFDYESERKK